ncbi:MAG TPA: lysophospholipid acyltransferase family protein [Vicinamibacterales bacterium]
MALPSEPRPPEPATIATWTRNVFNTGLAFGSIYRAVLRLPPGISHAMGHTGAWIAHRLMRETTRALIDNFRGAFPELDERTLDALALQTYRSYAHDAVDFFRAAPLPPERCERLFETVSDYHDLFSGLLARGRGVILITGHFGNWEMGTVLMRALQLPLTIVAMREASEEINRLRHEFRRKFGADTLEVRQSIDTALQIRRRLGENRIVAMLMDRHIGRDRIPVDFFGRRAFFLKTPPLLAWMTGAPLLPCAIYRVANGRFAVRPGEPIIISRELDREHAVQAGAQAFATQLEKLIREHPYYWYQFYPYWQSQQDDAAVTPAA